jgi:lipoyl(octanoyl) transferase
MGLELPHRLKAGKTEAVLQAYLLGAVEFEAALALQRRMVYTVTGDREQSFLVLCEHHPLITVGRQGSRTHIRFDPDELRTRGWPVRWVNRGGGCLLHLPGQLAIYPVVALDRLGLGLQAYLDRLQQVVLAVLDDFGVRGQTRPERPGVWVGGRLIAEVGVAVRAWVSYYGIALNINPDLELFRQVHTGRRHDGPMTSLVRERRGPLRPALVRQQLLDHFAARFAFAQVLPFSDHPSLCRRAPSDALASRS